MKYLLGCFFLSVLHLSEHYKILGIFPLASSSHNTMFESLMKGLAAKGHEVDVLSHFPQKKALPRYTDISLRGSLPLLVNNVSIPLIQVKTATLYDTIQFILVDGGSNPCRSILNTTAAKELKNSGKNYDLLITEVFGSDCMLGFGHHFNIPVVTMTSSVTLPWGGDPIGNPDNPSYIPNYLMPYLSRMTLMERLFNTVVLLGAKLSYTASIDINTEIAREFFGPDLPNLGDLAYKTNLILVNSHFSISQARPTVPNFIEVGGLHIQPEKPLPKHFKNSLAPEPQYKGVIYLSMGSMILSETLPYEKLSAFFEAFRELPYKVLWKGSRENIPKNMNIPTNVQFEPWMPQLDILCHPNVKLFVTHGGCMGSQEAIYCGIPRLGIALFADQDLNLKASEAMGVTIKVAYDNLTKVSILEAATELLNNPKYKSNAKRVSQIFRDRPLSAMETAIYWVEYVIKYHGAPQLRTVGADLPWYQYFLVDVAAILLTILFTTITVVWYLTAYVFQKLVFSQKDKVKPKTN